MSNWIRACAREEIEIEDLVRFDYGERTFAIYRSPNDEFYCTDGLCTHEDVHLENGLVIEHIIHCPMHNGQLEYRTGQAMHSPFCAGLFTNPVKVERNYVFIKIL